MRIDWLFAILISHLFYYVECEAFTSNTQAHFSSLKDPWDSDEIKKIRIAKAPKLHLTYVTEQDPYTDPDTGELLIDLPVDYVKSHQEEAYKQEWEYLSPDQLKYYSLVEQSSTEFNNPNATYALYRMHMYGDYGIPHNKTLAWRYLRKFNELSKGSNATALFDTAIVYLTGLLGDIPVNTVKGLIYLRKASALGEDRAKQALGYRFIVGHNVPRNPNKALILYSDLAHRLYKSRPAEYWNFYDGMQHMYNVRLPDFYGGLLGRNLTQTPMSVKDRKNYPWLSLKYFFSSPAKPDYIYYTEDEMDVCELTYLAFTNFVSTYTQKNDYEASMRILTKLYETYDNQVDSLELPMRGCYCRAVELLGYMWLKGYGIEKADLSKAEKYLKRAIELVYGTERTAISAAFHLGTIQQYVYKNFTEAEKWFHASLGSSKQDTQSKKPEVEIDNETKYADLFLKRSYLSPFFRSGRNVEAVPSIGHLSYELPINFYKKFLEINEEFLAPDLETAFMNILQENFEPALWQYAQAAEQGFERAMVSAAYLIYRPPSMFQRFPDIPVERLKLSLSYYQRAISFSNFDAGVRAGDIYYKLGDYRKAGKLYHSTAMYSSYQSMWNLAYMYQHGIGFEQDFFLSKKYYELSTERFPLLYLLVKPVTWHLMFKSWLKNNKWIQRFSS
ncbi:HGL301Cp [Eremothecium sinecaudum]|uniref:HGL301Cp n=1 Tax=Eremothecium sinecaudum TaxID=45286 RepID=A0A0X8HV32_9SACH|nr:HGL301Cp [Eremothecium sinecaudum]AMD22039.1 HGL301Cp [Eremothecium sinecaudum]